MKVVYYHPRHLAASFIAAYLHANMNDALIDMAKTGEILKGFRRDRPFILYFGRGKKGEEVYMLNGDCAEGVIRRTINNLMSASGGIPQICCWSTLCRGGRFYFNAEASGIPASRKRHIAVAWLK